MSTVILDDRLAESLRKDRAESGVDRWDEVWEGTTMMAAAPNNEHQVIAAQLVIALSEALGGRRAATVVTCVNVSDRVEGWLENFRIPDVAVFLADGAAVDKGPFWFGGPDFAVKIVSRGDSTTALG